MKRPILATATLATLVWVVAVPTAVGCAGGDDGATADDDVADDCDVGVLLASSLTFEERLCLSRAAIDEGNRFVMEVGTRFSWDVQGFGGDEEVPPLVLDASNSSAFGHFDREGLSWVVSAGAIGGLAQGQSSLTVEVVAAAAGAFAGHLDGAAVPDFNNDTLDSVFVTIDISTP